MEPQLTVAASRGATSGTGRRAGALMEWHTDRDFVMSFARGLLVFNTFAGRERPQTIAEIAHATQLPRAAVRRLLHTLVELGYLVAERSAYLPTPRSLAIGHAFLSGTPLGRAAAPLVTRLANELDCVAMVTVEDADDILIVGTAGVRAAFPPKTVLPAIGARAPMYCSASGLLFMSEWSDDRLRKYLGGSVLAPYTHRTTTAPEQLHVQLASARAQRYWICDRTFIPTHRSLAVPVLDACGRVVAAVVAVTDAERWSVRQLVAEVLPRVSDAARGLSASLR